MTNDSPDLGVDFIINFGNNFGEPKSLDDLIGTISAIAVRDFQRIKSSIARSMNVHN